MPSYCTVCGVKLTAKNRISYRPSSCRDCELERKRLYSLKRKLQKEQENQSKGKSTKTKAKDEKKTTKTKVVKGTTSSKAKVVTKAPAKTSKTSKSSSSLTTRAKRSTVTKAAVSKVKETKASTSKAKTIAKPKASDKETKLKTTAKATTKAIEKKSTTKSNAAEKEIKAEPLDITKEETKNPETMVSKSKVAEKVEKKEASPFVALPSYIKDAAKTKVTKRRLAKDNPNATPSPAAKTLTAISSDEDASQIFALGKELSEDDLLRAPSETPWDSSSFKIVNGSFVEHGAEDQEESRGPSPEEIKNIIEKIRLEHKTRRS